MSNPAQGAVGAETMTAGLTLTFDPSKLFDTVAAVGDSGETLGRRIVGIMLSGARSSFREDLGLAFYGVTAAPSLASPRADSAERTAFRPGDLVRNARYDHRDAYPAFGESAYVQAVDGDYLDFGQGSKLLYSLFDLATPAQPAGAVPDSLRALSEAASEDWDTNEATPYILGPPIDGEIDRFEVIARGPHGYAKNGDDIRKWQANRMFAVAAVKHVRSLLASHPAGQSAGSGAEDRQHAAEVELQEIQDGAYGDNPMARGAARDALARLRARDGEDVNAWAQSLGADLARAGEAETTPDSTRTGQAEAIARAAYVRICRHDSKEGWQHAGADFDRREEDGGCYVNALELALAIGSDAAAALAARPAAAEAQGTWMPISTAPQTNEDVLVAASYWDEAGTERRYTTISSYLDQPYRRGFRHRNGAKNATDWMPLPEPTPAPPASSGQGGR